MDAAPMRPYPMPRTIKVLGKTFTVKSVKNLKIKASDTISASSPYATEQSDGWVHEHDELDILGLTDADAQIIVIETDLGRDTEKDTVLHETLHAVMSAAGIRDVLSGNDEERLVRRITPILGLLLRENPNVYTFLTGREVTGRRWS